jgi:TetR/AcrR family transcriptional regulator, transcriptional repressor for nem operon
MQKISNREKILTAGLHVVHDLGFGGASVRDIVAAAGVPQGSFSNNFVSKEAFGLEILDLYFADIRHMIKSTLADETLPPLQRLFNYIGENKKSVMVKDGRSGCMLGNFSAETTGRSEVIRHRLVECFDELQADVENCLQAAVAAGDLPPASKCHEIANFVISSLQGAILLAKTRHDPAPIDNFRDILFSTVLRVVAPGKLPNGSPSPV